MKQLLSTILLLLTALPALSQQIKLPSEVRGAIGEFIQVKADTPDAYVSWLAMDAGLNLFPTSLLRDTKTAVVVSTTPGRFRLLAVTAKGDKPSEWATTVVIVGDAPPVPPGPGPQPPGPGPTPTPTNEFEKAVFSAYALDPVADKVHTKSLAKIYRAAGKQSREDKLLVKVSELFEAVQTVRRGTIGEALPKTRAVVNVEFSKTMPSSTTALFTDELRNKAGQLFDESAGALEKLP